MLWCAGGQTCSLNPAMPICKVGLEDIRHCLFTCDRARLVWASLVLPEEIDNAVIHARSGSVNLDILIRLQKLVGDIPMAELILVTMWYIWWQRRQVSKWEAVPTQTINYLNTSPRYQFCSSKYTKIDHPQERSSVEKAR